MRDHLKLFINGRPLNVTGDDAFLNLVDFLRKRRRLTGTKVVCAEGDCGSCTVLLGRPCEGRIEYAAVTSCIQLMFQLDGVHIVTIEGLRQPDGRLNPIQQSMVQCQGTQCGFCTPGFVVAMYDLMHDGRPCDAASVTRGLVGNLCRCTGYDSIIQAAQKTDREALSSLDRLYPPENILPELERAAAEEVLIEAAPRKFYKPVTHTQAARFRSENAGDGGAGCVIVTGGSDVGVQVNKRIRTPVVVMAISGVAGSARIDIQPTAIRFGAGVTLSAFERTMLQHLPELGQFMAWFGSPLIKNAGTLAGNLANASPIGDTIPALTVLKAEIELTGLAGPRTVAIADFYTGYRRTAQASDELISAVHIPRVRDGELFRLFKVSRRKDLDISTFGAAIWMKVEGKIIGDVRIAYGGVGPMVMRMTKTENVLRGSSATRDVFEQAAAIAAEEVTPITDVRGSVEYRRALASGILLKFWHENLGDGNGGGNGAPSDGGNGHAGLSVDSMPRRPGARGGVPQGAPQP